MRRILFATLLCLASAATAFGQADVNIGPFQVRIQGYVGDPPAGVKPDYSWTVGRDGKVYKLQVMKHQSLSTTLSTLDINNKVYMYSPMFHLMGDDAAIKAFTTAKPGQLLEIMSDMRVDTQPGQIDLDTVKPIDKVK
jgi:hypothetical protein